MSSERLCVGNCLSECNSQGYDLQFYISPLEDCEHSTVIYCIMFFIISVMIQLVCISYFSKHVIYICKFLLEINKVSSFNPLRTIHTGFTATGKKISLIMLRLILQSFPQHGTPDSNRTKPAPMTRGRKPIVRSE